MVGLGLYTVGMITGIASEVDRKNKDKPNKGKPYGGGCGLGLRISTTVDTLFGGLGTRSWLQGCREGWLQEPSSSMTLLPGLCRRSIDIVLRRYVSLFSRFGGSIVNECAIVRRTVDEYQDVCALQALTLHVLSRMQEVRLGRW